VLACQLAFDFEKLAFELGFVGVGLGICAHDLIKKKPIIQLENILKGLKKVLPERYHHLLPLNEQALKRGMELAENAAAIV
jgi:hypothetical protein